jgi:hypothetical protein
MKKLERMERLTSEELEHVNGGWKLFGWEAIYKNQTMASVCGTSATGEHGKKWIAGVCVFEGFMESDSTTGVNDAIAIDNQEQVDIITPEVVN